MPPDDKAPRPQKLSVIVFSGDFDKVHYALAMVSAAVAVNMPATVFFTMEAIRALGRADADGTPRWQVLKTGGGEAAAQADALYAERGIATFEELLGACRELGARFMVCEMGLRAIGLTTRDLRGDIAYTEGGLVTFLNDARAQGAVVFV
jgi:peroxiredoxin family protein